jgi:hypothetical protein
MEWMNRGARSPQPAQAPVQQGEAPLPHSGGHKKKQRSLGFHDVTTVLLLFGVTVLTVAVIGFLMVYKQNEENRFVDSGKMQAVFLNGGQVYFGNIKALNNKYVGLTDIYYLRVSQQVQPKQGEQAQQDISLVKLGCELHGPQDQMLINREQVVFWENLKDDGQVAKAVAEYKKANPNGQKCEAGGDQQQSTPTGNTNNQQQEQQQNP